MAKKSIIEIDIQDERWQKFLEEYKKYDEALSEMPEDWKKVGQALGHTGSVFSEHSKQIMDHLEKTAGSVHDMANGLKKANHGMDQLGHATSVSKKGFKGLVKDAEKLSSTLFGVGKWVFKMGALGGIGGIFGMVGLGEAAFNREFQAKGLGLSPGQVKSFETNMFPYVQNPSALLETAANARTDINKWPWLSAMGIDPMKAQHMNAMDLSFKMMNRVRDIWKTGPHTQQFAESKGLLQMGFSMDDLRRLESSSGPRLRAAEEQTRKDVSSMNFTRQTAREYTDMVRTLRKAGAMIETVLIKGLAPLAPVLTHVAEVLTKDFVGFMNQPGTKKGIKNIAHTIEDFARFLGSKDLRKDIEDFAAAINDVTKLILNIDKGYSAMHPDLNLGDWWKAMKELGWVSHGNLFGQDAVRAFSPSSSEKKAMSLPPRSTGVSPPRPTAHKKISFSVTAPPGWGVERQINAVT